MPRLQAASHFNRDIRIRMIRMSSNGVIKSRHPTGRRVREAGAYALSCMLSWSWHPVTGRN